MKSIIYDIISGAAIIMALFVITDVMRANQNFIIGQTKAETDEEQVYLDENAPDKDNTFTAADVYGAYHTLLLNGNSTEDSSRWKVYEYTIIKVQIGSNFYTLDYRTATNADIVNLDNVLTNLVNTNPNIQFTRDKEAVFDTVANHKITTYTFKRK